MVDSLKRNMIVYIGEFDKHDKNGIPLCRNTNCMNFPRRPYRKYCSKKCNIEFRRWYYKNFFWNKVRLDIFKRDNYTCQICKKKFPIFYRRGKIKVRKLECDHIIPKSMFREMGYRFDNKDNKIKTVLEFFHNHDNLRTLCKSCHKEITSEYLQIRKKSP